MNNSRFSIEIWLILNLALHNLINGESIFEKLSVTSWLDSLGVTTEHPEVKEGPTVPTKIVRPEETIFNLAPKLQRFLDSNDFQSKENFIISPLSTVAIFGQLLIGLRGLNHELISHLLSLSHDHDRRKRGVIIIQESNDTLYDFTLYHGAFHFKLMTMIRKVLSDKPEDKVSLDYVMFYQQGIEFVPHFLTNMNKVYKPALETIPINFKDISQSTDTINEWGNEHMEKDLASRLGGVVLPQSQSFLLHTLVIECRWKTPMQGTGPEDFYVSPYQTVKVKYLKASLTTVYIDRTDFTLVSIPLNHDDTNVYILLPKGDNYNIQQYSQNLNSAYFENVLHNHQSLMDVDIKIPDVFYQYVNTDVMKPLRNYFNYETERKGKEHDGVLKLNGAAENVSMNNLLQHVYLSITNGDCGGLPKPIQSSQYSTQKIPEDSYFNIPYNKQQSYPTGKSSRYGGGYSVGVNNAKNMDIGGFSSSQYATQASSTIQPNLYPLSQEDNSFNIPYNTQQSYSTGKSSGYDGGYSVGSNNAKNMGMGGISSSQYSTQASTTIRTNLYPLPQEDNVFNIPYNTQQSYSTGKNSGYGGGYSVAANNANNMSMGGISSQPSLGWYNQEPIYPIIPQSSLLDAPVYNPQGFQYQTNPGISTNNYYSSIDSYPQSLFSSHASIGNNMHLSTDSMKKRPFLRKKRTAVYFEVTRPFLFIIMTEKNKIVLVWGSILNPATLQG